MSWTARESASSTNSISSFDAPASVAATYSATAQLTCNDEMITALTAIEGVTGFVQGASNASASGGVTSIVQAFVSNNIHNNCIVVDVVFNPSSIIPTGLSCADSQGNSYTQVFSQKIVGGDCQAAQFVAFGIAAGANTVTVTCTSNAAEQPCIAIHEYTGGTGVDTFNVQQQITQGTVTPGVVTSQSGEFLHLFSGIVNACPGSPIVTGPSGGNNYFDRSPYLFTGDGAQHTFNLQLRQRGVASYTLVSDPQNPLSTPAAYKPTLFQPVFLYDETASGFTLMFSGLVQDFTERWVGTQGLRFIDVSAVTLEAVLDTVYVDGTDFFVDQTCGYIVKALLCKYELGAPIGLGTVSAGASVPQFNPEKGTKLSDVIDQLAITSQFIWGIDPQTQSFFFCVPTTTAAPFNLTSVQALWDSISNKLDGADYRNRQGVKGSYDAFPHSMEFFAGSGQQSFTLMRPVEQVVTAYITLATCNTATGSISGNFSAGDTVTIGPYAQSRIASHIYGLGGPVTYQGYVQVVTTAGTSGSGAIGTGTGPQYSGPSGVVNGFNPVVGGVTTDGTVIWTNQGATGLATETSVYTAVSSLDNTQYGQFLIGASGAASLQNLVDCINSTVTRGGSQLRGVTFSLPTWEDGQCNALYSGGSSFTLQTKAAGTGWISGISTTSSAFSWSGAFTSGGTSPQGSVGPNEPGTITIQVYQQGTSTAAPGLAYVQGSATISLATPLNSGTNLNVEYTRTDGNVIEVEDTSLVTTLAAVSHGTGKIQQFTDQSNTGLIQTSALALLQFAQEALAAYDVVPEELEVIIYQPGILPGQVWTWDLDFNSQLNGEWFVTEVKAELVPTYPWLDNPNAVGAGHYRYTIKVVNISQLADYLDFWEGLGGGSSGGGAGAALVATSGGAVPTGGGATQIELETGGTPNSNQLLLNLTAGAGITITDEGGGDIEISVNASTSTHSEPLTDGSDNFIFAGTPPFADIVVVVGVPN